MQLDDLILVSHSGNAQIKLMTNQGLLGDDYNEFFMKLVAMSSDVMKNQHICEFLYSRKDVLNSELREVVAQCCMIMINHGFGDVQRALDIMDAMKRDDGMEGNFKSVDDDPPAWPEYIVAHDNGDSALEP